LSEIIAVFQYQHLETTTAFLYGIGHYVGNRTSNRIESGSLKFLENLRFLFCASKDRVTSITAVL
jgi:hypothetical protein